jgi:hypothetical protein
MQITDCDREPLAYQPIPESGRFRNHPRRWKSVSERLRVLLSRVWPATIATQAQRGGRSISTTSEFSR